MVDLPGALQIVPSILNLKPPTGVFTGVNGVITAVLKVPDGYTLDTGYGAKVTIKAPLSNVLFEALSVSTSADGKTLVASFNKADIDNNMDAGTAVPLTVSGLFHEWRSAEAADVDGQRTGDEVSESATVQQLQSSSRTEAPPEPSAAAHPAAAVFLAGAWSRTACDVLVDAVRLVADSSFRVTSLRRAPQLAHNCAR